MQIIEGVIKIIDDLEIKLNNYYILMNDYNPKKSNTKTRYAYQQKYILTKKLIKQLERVIKNC